MLVRKLSQFDLEKKIVYTKRRHEEISLLQDLKKDFCELQWIALYLLFCVKYLLQTDVFF